MIVFTGISGTTENSFYLGDKTDGYKTIYAYNSDVNLPGLRWNDDADQWEFSNDGTSWDDIGTSVPYPISATNGGTGQTSYSTGDLLYADSSTTLDKLSIGNDGYVMTISGGLPIWAEQETIDVNSLIEVNSTISDGTNIGMLETLTDSSAWDQSDLIFNDRLPSDIICIGGGRLVASTTNTENYVAVSEDYGKTWRNTLSVGIDSLEYLENGYVFAFKDESFGQGTIYRSSDYGETWSDLGTGSSISYGRGFVNLGNGKAIFFGHGPNAYVRITKTTNYGSTWTSKYYISTTNSVAGQPVYLGNGIIVGAISGDSIGGARVARSDDYGETWDVIDAGLTNSVGSTIKRQTIYLGNGIIIISGLNEIVRSTDYGLTWLTVDRYSGSNNGTIVHLGNGNILGFSSGFDVLLFKSSDYGITWGAATNFPITAYKRSAAYAEGILYVLYGLSGPERAYVYRLAKGFDPALLPSPETLGGTGQNTYTTGDFLYSDSTNNLSKLPIGDTNDILAVYGGVPSWQSFNSMNFDNTVFGYNAGVSTPDGYGNVFIGNAADGYENYVDYGVAIGFSSSVGDRSIAIGYQAIADGIDRIAIGYGSTPTSDNTYYIGDPITNPIALSAASYANYSDVRMKKQIIPLQNGLEIINSLNPVEFYYDTDIGSISYRRKHLGLIAQEVEDNISDIVQDWGVVLQDSDCWKLDYIQFISPLIKAVQQQQEQIEELRNQIIILKER